MKRDKVPKILIDCDPGADDFFALLWTMIMQRKGLCEIVGITTTGGNVSGQLTFENAHRAVKMMGLEGKIPVGITRTKVGNQADASHIHGSDGIGGASKFLDLPKEMPELESVDLIIGSIEKYGDELEILVFGPMTDFALVEKKSPGILKKSKRIIAMGGAIFDPGNVTSTSEFNVNFDPESAQVTLHSGANMVLIPLDVTHQTLFTPQDLEEILSVVDSEEHKTNYDVLETLAINTFKTNMMFRETRDKEGFIVHDASTVAFLFYPHLYSGTFYHVDVETKGEYTRGKTQVDIRNQANPSVNAFVALEVDAVGFMEAMTEDFKWFGG